MFNIPEMNNYQQQKDSNLEKEEKGTIVDQAWFFKRFGKKQNYTF